MIKPTELIKNPPNNHKMRTNKQCKIKYDVPKAPQLHQHLP